jgi:isopenicillin N synthase-like dioxygenase
LIKYGQKDTILAGFHTDLNFLTIHGRSRYPGLHIWARNTGKRIAVTFPPTGRYLLVQAGKQLEHMTGGLIKAGFHEVVVNEATLRVGTTSFIAVSRTQVGISGHWGTQGSISGSSCNPHLVNILLASLFGS